MRRGTGGGLICMAGWGSPGYVGSRLGSGSGADGGVVLVLMVRVTWVPACAGTTGEYGERPRDRAGSGGRGYVGSRLGSGSGADGGVVLVLMVRVTWVPACAGTTGEYGERPRDRAGSGGRGYVGSRLGSGSGADGGVVLVLMVRVTWVPACAGTTGEYGERPRDRAGSGGRGYVGSRLGSGSGADGGVVLVLMVGVTWVPACAGTTGEYGERPRDRAGSGGRGYVGSRLRGNDWGSTGMTGWCW